MLVEVYRSLAGREVRLQDRIGTALSITMHPLVEAQVLEIASSLHQSIDEIVQKALVETSGMIGVPIEDETVFGVEGMDDG